MRAESEEKPSAHRGDRAYDPELLLLLLQRPKYRDALRPSHYPPYTHPLPPSLPPPPPPPLPARSALPLSIGAETKATGSGGPGRCPRTPGATGPAPRHSPALRGPRIRRLSRAPRCQTSENLPKTHRMNFLVPRIQDGDVSTAEAAGSKTFTL